MPLVLYQEALHTLHTLRRYKKAYKRSDEVILRALRSFKRDLAIKYHCDGEDQAKAQRYNEVY
jgi:hypothetical protein